MQGALWIVVFHITAFNGKVLELRADKSRFLPEVFFAKSGVAKMSCTANGAERHTHKAITPELKELRAEVANRSLEWSGDEGREANAGIARQARSGQAALIVERKHQRPKIDLLDFVLRSPSSGV